MQAGPGGGGRSGRGEGGKREGKGGGGEEEMDKEEGDKMSRWPDVWVSQVGQDVRSDLTVILQHTTLRLCFLPDQKNGGGGHWYYPLRLPQ